MTGCKRWSFVALALAVIGCGSGDSMTTASYSSVAGSYSGPVSGGPVQNYTFNEVLTLTIAQSSGSLSGTFSTVGLLYFGTNPSTIQSTGTFSGTINSGNNPSVNITIQVPGCPSYRGVFSGAYDSTNHKLTISGPFDFFNQGTCTVGLTFQETLILSVN